MKQQRKIQLVLMSFALFLNSCEAQENKKLIDIKGLQKTKEKSSTITELTYTGTVDFRYAAKVVTPVVAHLKSVSRSKKQSLQKDYDEQDFFHDIPDQFKDLFKEDPFFRHFEFRSPRSYPYQPLPRQSSGSAVIISADGYVVTNNHVIRDADEIELTLFDRRTYSAVVVGSDPQTDLALLKIEEDDLPFIVFANSDSIAVGEWVVAVGNPFNLASTVTAGIVSAKARNINILKDQGAIESFIQTDAAVNPGNSGGALVNLEGKLIGINTAIATPTGTYAGYAFAIPSNIVRKIINDLLNYGKVQRGYLGIVIRDLNGELASELAIERTTGVFVDSLVKDGAAHKAGIKERDVIIKIDSSETLNAPQLQEIIARKRPGEKVSVHLIRDGKEKEIKVTLRNIEGNTKIEKKESSEVLRKLGVELKELSMKEKKEYKVDNGVRVAKLYGGKLRKYTDIKEGFVIVKVNNIAIDSVEEFIQEVERKAGGVMLEGKYQNDILTYYYAFGM